MLQSLQNVLTVQMLPVYLVATAACVVALGG